MNTGTRNPRKRSLTPVGDKEDNKAKRASSRSAAKQKVPPPVLARNRRTSLTGGSGFKTPTDQELNGHFEVVSSREPTNKKPAQSETLNTTTMDRNKDTSASVSGATPITVDLLKTLLNSKFEEQNDRITDKIQAIFMFGVITITFPIVCSLVSFIHYFTTLRDLDNL